MQVYWSEQYTFDFSPYLRHIFAVKHIYLTLYVVRICRVAPIYSVPVPCSLCCSRPPARSVPAARRARLPAPVRACARARCARLCVRLLMPGQRWTFLSAVPVWPALLARFPCACGRARARVCVGAVRLPSSRLPCILFAYNVHSPPLCQACPPRFHLAANFFEIVFKPSISISPSLSWVDDATLYCHMGCFVDIVMP